MPTQPPKCNKYRSNNWAVGKACCLPQGHKGPHQFPELLLSSEIREIRDQEAKAERASKIGTRKQ